MSHLWKREAISGIFRQPRALSDLWIFLHAGKWVFPAARADRLCLYRIGIVGLLAHLAVRVWNSQRSITLEHHGSGRSAVRDLVRALLESAVAGDRPHSPSTGIRRFRIPRPARIGVGAVAQTSKCEELSPPLRGG